MKLLIPLVLSLLCLVPLPANSAPNGRGGGGGGGGG
ncbi:MAG: hypothetical protein RLZZ244_1128, partial [Verrucomicrobiota bacterium]